MLNNSFIFRITLLDYAVLYLIYFLKNWTIVDMFNSLLMTYPCQSHFQSHQCVNVPSLFTIS